MCPLTAPFGTDSQPLVEFPSTAYLQSLLLEDWLKQLPPYFCDATLNGLQVEDAETKSYLKKKKDVRSTCIQRTALRNELGLSQTGSNTTSLLI